MRPYPPEVRERVIQLLEAGWSTRQVADEIRISPRTVQRDRHRARHGQLAPWPIPGRTRQIPPSVAAALTQHIQHHPRTTLCDLRDWLATTYAIRVSLPTVSRTLQRLGFRRRHRPRISPPH